MKPYQILLVALFLSSLTIQSCNDDNEGDGDITQLQNPGDVIKGVAGCSSSQRKAIEDMPGMGNIATTTLGEDGSYVYADTSGNTCTLDSDGNIKMEGTDGSIVTRDNTINQSTNSQATVLSNKVMVGTNEESEQVDYVGMKDLLERLVESMPEATQVVEVKTKTTPKQEIHETDYDSIRISFQNEICLYEVIAKHKSSTHTYNLVETEYIAHDGYFDCEIGHMHMVIENGYARLYLAEQRYNEETNMMEWVDASPASNYYPERYTISFTQDYDIVSDYRNKPSRSEYFNYRFVDNGNVILTNKTRAIFLEKESSKWYEDKAIEIKYEVLTSDENSKDDEEDEIIICPPSPIAY